MATTKETAAAKAATTPPVPLTLQQKFIKLREAVPSITQKAHSDGVKYKFAKIFDVYQLLTPAMNEFGVNFDIVGEQATRHSENGDPIYYSNFTQHTRNGDRIVWVYEADLTIRWTNADNPDETLEVTLHAIGTNDGGPDKAKGSAWTYCLKYYLFEKFGIDQGDNDPDMSDHSSEPPQQSQKQHTGVQNGNRQGNTQPQAQNGQTGRSGAARPLSDAQLSRLYRKGEDAGYSQQSINEWILKKYGQQDPHNLTRAQYDEACAAMDNAKQHKTMLNHVELLGRLAQEPEIRYTQSGTPVASFDLAVQVPSKNKDAAPDYIPIVCWRERAEFCGRYLSKGRQIVVEGRISTRKWKDEKTGQNRKAVEVVASNIYFADSNGGNANGNPQPANNDGFMDIPDDGQLPFN